jgi:hypothetical protein
MRGSRKPSAQGRGNHGRKVCQEGPSRSSAASAQAWRDEPGYAANNLLFVFVYPLMCLCTYMAVVFSDMIWYV